jgi:hypothetical protein
VDPGDVSHQPDATDGSSSLICAPRIWSAFFTVIYVYIALLGVIRMRAWFGFIFNNFSRSFSLLLNNLSVAGIAQFLEFLDASPIDFDTGLIGAAGGDIPELLAPGAAMSYRMLDYVVYAYLAEIVLVYLFGGQPLMHGFLAKHTYGHHGSFVAGVALTRLELHIRSVFFTGGGINEKSIDFVDLDLADAFSRVLGMWPTFVLLIHAQETSSCLTAIFYRETAWRVDALPSTMQLARTISGLCANSLLLIGERLILARLLCDLWLRIMPYLFASMKASADVVASTRPLYYSVLFYAVAMACDYPQPRWQWIRGYVRILCCKREKRVKELD